MADPFVFKVNLGGMIDILANHLYSSPDVFIRELLQNGTDAISARKRIAPDFAEGCIRIQVEPGQCIHFTDNGSGLTEPEIHQFLAVIGQSSKRDLTTGRILEDYIGRFGIGMLSCFMVTDEITLRTRSAKDPSHAYEFHGKPDGTYSITELPAQDVAIGTAIRIAAKKGCERYFDEAEIARLVRFYGLPLPFPVMMQTAEGEYRINEMFRAGKNAEESMMALAKGKHRIYLKNMLLTEDGDAILPKWSGFLRVFLNTTALRPTASRESFYEDELLMQAREELSECISSYLIDLSHKDPVLLEQMIRIHIMAIKSMASEDDVFFRTFIPFIQFETNTGTLSGKELLSMRDPICYTTDINQYHRAASLVLWQGRTLVNACYVYDLSLLRMMQSYEEDMILMPLELGSFDNLFEEPPTDAIRESDTLMEIADDVMRRYDARAQLKSFSPSQQPVFYMLDKQAETLREIHHARDNAHALFASMLDAFAEEIEEHTAALYLNWSNPLIRRLAKLDDTEKIRVCVEILYVQELLTGRFPLQGNELSLLNKNLIQLIEWGTAE